MLIQSSPPTPVPGRFVGDGAPVIAAAPPTSTPAEMPRVAPQPVSAVEKQAAANSQPTASQLQSAVDTINKSMKSVSPNLSFSFDEDVKRVMVKVTDSSTGEVIKQFPSEAAIAIARAVEQMQKNQTQKGLLFEQKA